MRLQYANRIITVDAYESASAGNAVVVFSIRIAVAPPHTRFNCFLWGDDVLLRFTQREALGTYAALFVCVCLSARVNIFLIRQEEREKELCSKKIGNEQQAPDACKAFKEKWNMHVDRKKEICTVAYVISIPRPPPIN